MDGHNHVQIHIVLLFNINHQNFTIELNEVYHIFSIILIVSDKSFKFG